MDHMISYRLILFLCTLLLGSGTAVACQCGEQPTIAHAFAESELVVTGTVVRRDTARMMRSSGNGHKTIYGYAIVPDRIHKGVRQDTMYVCSSDDAGDRGFLFTVGMRYVIYADVVDAAKEFGGTGVWMTWVTSRRTRTRAFDEKEVQALEALK